MLELNIKAKRVLNVDREEEIKRWKHIMNTWKNWLLERQAAENLYGNSLRVNYPEEYEAYMQAFTKLMDLEAAHV